MDDFCPCDDIDFCECDVEENATDTFIRWSDEGMFDGPSDADSGL